MKALKLIGLIAVIVSFPYFLYGLWVPLDAYRDGRYPLWATAVYYVPFLAICLALFLGNKQISRLAKSDNEAGLDVPSDEPATSYPFLGAWLMVCVFGIAVQALIEVWNSKIGLRTLEESIWHMIGTSLVFIPLYYFMRWDARRAYKYDQNADISS